MKAFCSVLTIIFALSTLTSCEFFSDFVANDSDTGIDSLLSLISPENLNGWDEGYTDSRSFIAASRIADSDSTIIYINSVEGEEDGVYFLFDEENTLLGFGNTKQWYLTTEADAGIFVSWFDDEGAICGELLKTTDVTAEINLHTKTLSSTVNTLLDGHKVEKITTILGALDSADQICTHANNHEWFDLSVEIARVIRDLGLAAIKVNPGVSIGLFVIDTVIDGLNSSMYERQRNAMYAQCTTEITEISINDKGELNVFVTLRNSSSIPTHLYHLYYHEPEEIAVNNVYYGVVGRRGNTPTSTVFTEPYKSEEIINRNAGDERYLMYTFAKPKDNETYYFRSYLKSSRLADKNGKVQNSQIQYSKSVYYKNVDGRIYDFKQISCKPIDNVVSFKCLVSATCNDTSELIWWALYYQDDNGVKTTFNPMTYDEPSMNASNSAEFEINIDIPRNTITNGYKDIKLGIIYMLKDSSWFTWASPQNFSLTYQPLTINSIVYDTDNYYYYRTDNIGYVAYHITANISGNTNCLEEFQSCGIYLWNSEKNESYILPGGLSRAYYNTPIKMSLGVDESDFDKRDDSRYYAECTKYYFGVYVQFNDGSYYMSEPVQCKFVYDRKPSYRYTSVGPISVSVAGSKENEDGETVIEYNAEHPYSYFYEGVFWIDSIQWWCDGSWYFLSTGEKYSEPWTPTRDYSDAYETSRPLHYWSTTDMYHSVWHEITTKTGEKLYSNSLVYGGTPENPTVSISGTRSYSSMSNARLLIDNNVGSGKGGSINFLPENRTLKKCDIIEIEDLEILYK